jgi:hypothetical protein
MILGDLPYACAAQLPPDYDSLPLSSTASFQVSLAYQSAA